MLRWNGWGDETVRFDLPAAGRSLLTRELGPGRPRPDASLESLLARVPPSRLPKHPAIATQPLVRLEHAHGQSMSDWIDLRGGTLQHFPDGVALPRRVDDLPGLFRWAASHDTVIIPFGGGTSVVGHVTVPALERPVLSLAMRHLNRLVALDPFNRLATFEAGVRGPDLEGQLRVRGFTLGHFPQSFELSTLGGWIATRSSGQQAAHYGRMEDLFAGGDVLTPRGRLRLPPFPASAAGPDLRQFVLGSEGRLGLLTRAVVRISPLPERDEVYGFFFPSWKEGLQAIRRLAAERLPVAMVRLSDPLETQTNLALSGHPAQVRLLDGYLRLHRQAEALRCMCLIGLCGTRRRVAATRKAAFALLRAHRGVALGRALGAPWKRRRFEAPYLRNTLWDLGYAVDTLETAVLWSQVTPLMERLRAILQGGLVAYNEKVLVFSHVSQSYSSGANLYTTFVFRNAGEPEDLRRRWQTLKERASRAIVAAGGTISHQHGVGSDHRPYLSAEKGRLGIDLLKGAALQLDPRQRMNPTKLFA